MVGKEQVRGKSMKKAMSLLLVLTAWAAVALGQGERVTSVLETLDITTGERTVVKEFPYRIEAPNWSRDGRWLIFNSGGLIMKVDASGRDGEVRLVNTGYLTHCNNDHVLSADGKRIAVSSSPGGDGVGSYTSYVYILPLDGGEPRLVTPVGPSYLHGWSPDGKLLAYCAFRDNGRINDVYTISTDGGEEKRLTFADGLDDGPEFSPDGKHIWFCSVRTGLMQLWRMNVDGSGQTQMTFDETRNSWFPHVSPDGQWVIFITYHRGDVEPGQHLPNKQVELRLMPAKGGEARTVAELFGGQGTINVNSWSPDSRKVAFVSYKLNKQ